MNELVILVVCALVFMLVVGPWIVDIFREHRDERALREWHRRARRRRGPR